MKLARWIRFEWDLRQLPGEQMPLTPPYRIRQAERADHRRVADLLMSNFALDADWTDLLQEMRVSFEAQVAEVFSHKEVPCLVVTLGQTLVGASVLDLDVDSQNHLISGPSVMAEYRNRGIGGALLHESLRHLASTGLTTARAITRIGVPTAKFLYPKFNSTSSAIEREPAPVPA